MASLQIKLEPILPENNFLAKKGAYLLASLENVVKGDIADQLKDAMGKRVANWKHKPEMKDTFQSLTTRLSLLVIPFGRNSGKWRMVSGGVRPHFIGPKMGKRMLFIRGGKGGYSPKTRPGNSYGGSGAYSSNHYWAKFVAPHPGIQARNFEQHVVDEETPKIINKIQQVIDRAARA